MTITFLGTGTSQGIPMIGSDHPVCHSTDPKDKRMRSSVLLSDEGFQITIDCGPDFRMQMLAANVRHLDGIIFTHEHSDHIAGLDDIRQYSNKLGHLPVYAERRVLDVLIKRYDYIFDDNVIYKGKAKAEPIEIYPEISFKINQKSILPIPVMHGDLPILGYRIDDFAYLTDVSAVCPTSKQLLHNLDVLVVDALRIEPHYTHFNLDQALALIDELQPGRAYLTHISHRLGFHEEVQKNLPEDVFVSYDGLTIHV